MRTFLLFALTAQVLTGCGAAAVHSSSVQLTRADSGSLTVGEPQVLSAQVNPMQPLTASATGNTISVTFARRGQQGSVLDVDADSLRARSSTEYRYDSFATSTTLPATGAESVALADGGSLLLWTEGSMEWGHRAMAQSFGAGGTPTSAKVILSPARMDVVGAPHAATIDGHRVVATLAATEGQAFELVAVPIQVL